MDDIYYEKGLKFFYGNGVRKDLGKAVWWLKRAATLGNSKAMYSLGEVFLLAEENVKHPDITWFMREDEVYRDLHQAFYWFNCCYRNGYDLDLSTYGFGLKLNEENILEYFLEAIKMPRREEIMFQIGRRYFRGTGGKQKDIGKAIFWLMEAVKHGSNSAAYMLGEIYRKGECVTRNINCAVFWYEKASNRNYLKAMYKIGKMYRDGNGVEKDLEKACHYFEEVLQNLRWSVL